jgi:hypothetical protein
MIPDEAEPLISLLWSPVQRGDGPPLRTSIRILELHRNKSTGKPMGPRGALLAGPARAPG